MTEVSDWVYRVVVDGPGKHAVCNGEVAFVNVDGRRQVAAAGAGPGVMVFQGAPPRPILQFTKPAGEDGVDFRTFQLLRADPRSLVHWTLQPAGSSSGDDIGPDINLGTLAFLRPTLTMDVDSGGVWADRVTGLCLCTPVGFAESWEQVGTVYMDILCTDVEQDAQTYAFVASFGDPMALACKAVDACVNGDHGMVALVAEAIVRYCVQHGVATVDQVPAGCRWFVSACIGGLQDVTGDMREIEEARRARLALEADAAVPSVPELGIRR